jgi:hypothetical protein
VKAQVPVKRRKARRSKGMPKRPLSAYNFFFGQVRRMGALEGEGCPGNALGFAGLARAVASSWKSLDEDAKKPFYDMADHEQIRYKAACDEWRKSKRRYLNSQAKFDYVLQPKSPTPVDSQQRRTAPTAHAPRRNIPQHTNCYSPETTHGYPHVPGVISVSTEVTNDSNDSLDLSPRHYGNFTPNGYDNFYDTNTYNTNTNPYNYNTSTYNTSTYNTSTYNTNTYNAQSQRNGHPGHYANFRNESTGPIHSTEQHGGYYSGPVISPGAYDATRSGNNGPAYSSDYYGNTHSNNDYGAAQHMWSLVPPAVAGRRNPNDYDHDKAPPKRPCPASVPSVATVGSSASLADMEGESDNDEAPWKRTSSPSASVPSLATADSSTSLADMEGEPDCDAAPWKRPFSLNVPSLATVGSSASLGCPFSIDDTKESSGHNILGKAESFEHMMDELEKEDDSCDVWAWLKAI